MLSITIYSFTGIGPKLASKITTNVNINYDRIPTRGNEFELCEVIVLEVNRLIEKLSVSKSNGLDNIPVRLPKASAPTTIESLTSLTWYFVLLLSQLMGNYLQRSSYLQRRFRIIIGLYLYCQ
jgi:hypothetical protein